MSAHRFNVQMRDGIHWMTRSEIVSRFGPAVLDSDAISHSEFCFCRQAMPRIVADDPFAPEHPEPAPF